MNKKIISLVLALVMVLGTFTSVFAAEPTKKDEAKKPAASEKVEKIVGKDNKIQYIIDKKLVEGYEDGSYGLDKNIKRSEITRLLVLANGNEDIAKKLQGAMKIYTDVDTKHWANGVISVGTTVPSDANGLAMLAGYPDGSFKPENDVTYAELAKMLVVLAKKDLTADMVKNAVWATSWMTWAAQLGILDDVDVKDSNMAANRADAFTMIYNALYKMQEFKRVPANETRGILSELDNKTLQLNQDSKMEYKITDSTVFVIGVGRQQIQRVNVLNNKEYYLGSLVRILVNDKNEVTHIIELGNPAKMALNNAGSTAGRVLSNPLWKGVADNTASTLAYVGDKNSALPQTGKASYVTFGFNSDKTEAKRINFENEGTANDISLRINDKTEVYVANPANNQMRQVKDVAEALSLLGYQNYLGNNAYRVYNVYAGFDTDSISRNWKEIKVDASDRNTAKVIVFNLVNKNKSLDKYRVLESSSSKFSTTLENTDGKLFERDNARDTFNFPLNYGDKFDVIGMDNYRSSSNMVTYIDHSSSNFPIVKVTKVDSDKNYIEIEDIHGERSFLDIRDADIFSAKRFGKLEAGVSIQFRVENKNSNVAEIISLLGNEPLRDSIKGILPSADKAQRVGRLTEVKNVNGVWHMVVRVDYNLFDEADRDGYATYIVADENVAGLKNLIGHKIAFKVFERNYNGLFIATDIRLNDEAQTPVPQAKTAKELIQTAVNLYGKDFAGLKFCSQLAKATELRDQIEATLNNLGLERDNWEAAKENEAYVKAFKEFKAQIDKIEENKKATIKVADDFAGAIKLEKLTKDDVTAEKLMAKINEGAKAVKAVSVNVVPGRLNTAMVYVRVQATSDDGNCCISKEYAIEVEYTCPETEPKEIQGSCVTVDGKTCPVADENGKMAGCTDGFCIIK